jgi:hypothetical protein
MKYLIALMIFYNFLSHTVSHLTIKTKQGDLTFEGSTNGLKKISSLKDNLITEISLVYYETPKKNVLDINLTYILIEGSKEEHKLYFKVTNFEKTQIKKIKKLLEFSEVKSVAVEAQLADNDLISITPEVVYFKSNKYYDISISGLLVTIADSNKELITKKFIEQNRCLRYYLLLKINNLAGKGMSAGEEVVNMELSKDSEINYNKLNF